MGEGQLKKGLVDFLTHAHQGDGLETGCPALQCHHSVGPASVVWIVPVRDRVTSRWRESERERERAAETQGGTLNVL